MAAHNLTVDDVAVGGTTAKHWAQKKDALKEAVDKNPDAKYIWLTISGNDWIPKMIEKVSIDKMLAKVMAD